MGYNAANKIMKKNCFIALLLILCCLQVICQEEVGTFTMGYFSKNPTKKVECTNPDAANFQVFIDAAGDHSSDNVNLIVKGKDLDAFKNALIQIRDKYVEWEKVAKENNVTDMRKEFGISLPSIGVGWYGTKWWFAFSQKFTPDFMVFEDGRCAMVMYKKVTASSNQYTDQEGYFVIQSKAEFDELIELLDIQKMRSIFTKKEQNEDLFK